MVAFAIPLLSGVLLGTMTLAMPTGPQQTLALRLVQQFANFTWIENMAVRSNGQILGTNFEGGNVFLIDPSKPSNPAPPVLASFGKTTALTGIVEVEDDVFYVAGISNSDAINLKFPPNSSSVWEIDMRPFAKTGQPAVKKVADTPQIQGPNGMTVLSKPCGTILIADSAQGLIWRFNVYSGQHEIVINDDLFKPIKGSPAEFGVNGITLVQETLYFSNTNQGILGTFSISADGTVTGCPNVISDKVPNADDFAIGPDGSVFLAENQSNAIVRVFPNGKIMPISSGQNATSQPVSARFGRTPQDEKVLYISTDGLSFGADGKTPLTTDGKVLAVDIQ